MGKLHELLAVESDLATQAQRVMRQVKELFSNPEKFLGKVRQYRPLDDEGHALADEVTNLSTTVNAELGEVLTSFRRWLDASLQKEQTNQKTKADIEIDGKTLLPGLSAPALLNLESKLATLRDVLGAVPTNDTTERWQFDEQAECYVSEPRITYRTEKVPKVIVGYEATEHHPAQVQYINQDVRVGEWKTVIRSGMWQPNEKRKVLDKLDRLIMAVRQARQRANDIEVDTVRIADTLLKYVME